LAFSPFDIPSEDTFDKQNIFPTVLSTVKNNADVEGDKAFTCFKAASNAYRVMKLCIYVTKRKLNLGNIISKN